MKVQGKTIVVTGGGNGMGRELTLLLLKKGACVAAVDINETTLKETASLVGSDAKMMDYLCRLMPERAAKIIYNQMRSLLLD